MSITLKPDSEIIAITKSMIDAVVEASNRKDWESFSQYQTSEEANIPENKLSVEKLWTESKFHTCLSLEREVLGVLRRGDVAVVFWKQTSSSVSGEYLASYHIKEIDQQVKEVGFLMQ